MSDEMDYTINDPASVECPYCGEDMDLEGEVMSNNQYNMDCEHCGRPLVVKVDVEVTVLAWKPEAYRESQK